jgi:hypothetical protein
MIACRVRPEDVIGHSVEVAGSDIIIRHAYDPFVGHKNQGKFLYATLDGQEIRDKSFVSRGTNRSANGLTVLREEQFRMQQGSTHTPLTSVLLDFDTKQAINISDATVSLQITDPRRGTVILHAPAELGNDVGKVVYQWREGDTDISGNLWAEWLVTYPDGSIEVFPNVGRLVVEVIPRG